VDGYLLKKARGFLKTVDYRLFCVSSNIKSPSIEKPMPKTAFHLCLTDPGCGKSTDPGCGKSAKFFCAILYFGPKFCQNINSEEVLL
jgi:hypothetical protein